MKNKAFHLKSPSTAGAPVSGS